MFDECAGDVKVEFHGDGEVGHRSRAWLRVM